jgi:ABC-type spermidine/putrescine transport system permease subunit II
MSALNRLAPDGHTSVRRHGRRRVGAVHYWFLLPTLALFTGVVTVPAAVGIFYSFTDYVGFGKWSFTGVTNYLALFSDPAIWGSYKFTIGFALVTVVLAQVAALALALGLTSRIHFSTALRGVFVIPMVISGIVIAYVFSYLFSDTLPNLATSMGFKPLEQSILGNPQLAWIAIVLGLAVGHAAMYGPQASFLSELFGTKVRYSGVSLGYNLASIFAGALSPLIATGLMTAYAPQTWPISLYMVALALITIVSVYFATETRQRA